MEAHVGLFRHTRKLPVEELIKKLLQKSPEQRLSAKEAGLEASAEKNSGLGKEGYKEGWVSCTCGSFPFSVADGRYFSPPKPQAHSNLFED